MEPKPVEFKKVKTRKQKRANLKKTNKLPEMNLGGLDHPDAIKKMTDFAARGHTEEEKKQLDEQYGALAKKVEGYEELYQANKKENQELLEVNKANEESIEMLLKTIEEQQSTIAYYQRENTSLSKHLMEAVQNKKVSNYAMDVGMETLDLLDKTVDELNKKLKDQCDLNHILKETNDDLQDTIDLQQKYCDALRLLSMSEDKPVWNKEVAFEVAKNYNGYYEQMVLAYDKDVSEAVAITWQVNDKSMTAEEAIDKIHKIFVKNEGISSMTDRDFKKLLYHQYALSKPKVKKAMNKELERMDFQLKELLRVNKDPKMEGHLKDIHELQEAFSNIDNYKEEPELKQITHQIKKL